MSVIHPKDFHRRRCRMTTVGTELRPEELPFGHVGWGFCERAEFLRRAAEYIADGVRQNQRVVYVGEADSEVLLAELAAMSQIVSHLVGGSIEGHRSRRLLCLPTE